MTRTARCASLFALFVLFAVNCSAQSLADFARKERERRAGLKSTVTIVSIPQGEAATTAAGTSSTTTAASPAAALPAGPKDNQGRDEKYWRETFAKARADLKRAEGKVATTELRLKDLNTQLLQGNDALFNRDYRLAAMITETQTELEVARKDLEQSKQKLFDLEEELRRSGGLPGWAR